MPGTRTPTADPADSLAWREEQLADPHAAADKAERVRNMFARIARSYDLNNRVHSMWRDQAWRRKTVKLCRVRPTDVVLDVACGTGDLSMAFADAGPRRVIGLDFTHEMLQVARQKVRSEKSQVRSAEPRQRGAERPLPTSDFPLATPAPFYADGDAMNLPVADGSVDVVSIAFGIRNVSSPAKAVGEFARVLRPGGRLAILEFSLPTNPVLRAAYNFYFRHVLPRTATLIAGDRTGAYKYLPKSVNTFIGRPQMIDLMRGAGFGEPTVTPVTFGIAVIYVAEKPA